MNRSRHPSWAVLALAVAALALAGCGRKAGLDAPPGAAAAATVEPQPGDPASKSGLFDASSAANAPPMASKGRKKPFILDPLLD
uniref:Lipoprotein n=1 Tax=Rhodopseudomonas palustris (strain BisA53) TaxID=316055 RepID=Q07H24_RHOP5